MQYPPLTDQAAADYAEAIRQIDHEIGDIDEVWIFAPDPCRDLARWNAYHDVRRRRREAIAERDQLQRIVNHYTTGAAQSRQEARHAAI